MGGAGENIKPFSEGGPLSASQLEAVRQAVSAESSPLTPGKTVGEGTSATGQDVPRWIAIPAIVTEVDTTDNHRVGWKFAVSDTSADPKDEFVKVKEGLQSQDTKKEYATLINGAEGLCVDDPIIVFEAFNSDDELYYIAMRDQPRFEWLRIGSHASGGVYPYEIFREDADGILIATGITGTTAREVNGLTTIVTPVNILGRFAGFEDIGGVPTKMFSFICCGPYGSASGGF